MKILSFLQSHKLFVHYATIVTVVLGISSFFLLQRETRPNVNFNRVNITAAYPGASPVDIEGLVIDPIEDKLAEVDGIEEYRSVSYMGAGSISVIVDENYPDPNEVINEVRRKVSEVDGLPVEVDDPIVTELKAESMPVLNLALYGDAKPFDLKFQAEKLKDFLQQQDGVTNVSYTGITNLQLKVLLKRVKLTKFDLTIDEIFTKLSNWSKQKPGGIFENSELVASMTIGEDLNSLEKVGDFIVQSNDSGKKIRLKDVADIIYDLEENQTGNLFEDQVAVLFTVTKSPSADAIRTVDSVKKELTSYKKSLPSGLNLKLYKDESINIRTKLKIVTGNAIVGLLLVLVILIIFLDWRSALITSLGIPVSILGGVLILFLLGFTLNSLVVVGVIIVLGMLVDDAIVVCENIYSKIEQGLPPARAAIEGTREVAAPVMSSVATTVFAFLPIAFMGDVIGQFLRVIPITVIALLFVSVLEAFFVIPVHSEELMKPQENKSKKGIMQKVESLYEKYVLWSIRKRAFVVGSLVLFFIISLFQGQKIFDQFSLVPSEGLEGLSVRLELDKNTPLSATSDRVKNLSRRLINISDGTFDNIYSDLGQVTTGGSGGSRQNGTHLAMINISFTSDPSFIHKEKEVLKRISKEVENFSSEFNVKTTITLDLPGPPVGKPVQVQIATRDFDFGISIIKKIKEKLQSISGTYSIETDFAGDSIQYRFRIDNEFTISQGVDPSKISRTIFAASTGLVSSEILKNSEKIDILVGLEKGSNLKNKNLVKSEEIESILNLTVRNSNNQAVPIRNFVKIYEELGPSSIQRLNGIRTLTLFGEVDERVTSGKKVNQELAPYLEELREKYPNLKIIIGGGEKDRASALIDTLKLYAIAILLIYIAISLTFDSVIYPFLVLTALPMGVSGVVWALVLHGKSLSLMGIIGLVGLSGVVVNVSIIYLKFIQDNIRSGEVLDKAIVLASVNRIRPIIMTTISTLLGLFPTIYGVGGVDAFVQPIALVLGWGLFVATLLTITTLPALLSFFTILNKK
ncbi:putative transmembrane Acr-type transport protein [Halobacteriovorax marinus SJ]|uniref:Transmembrane Acr-type transport protein n=1 Tax=Halobacteriovorax marinus (strain ATCC BAA-682 / DSM 15412 / SJ) TaxID=862908 RepID=E1X3I9_HALMS|nr:efflux RND transporter permease subunit [Halobacteriovorax marinus]CBW26918.1 putative transmembrane Acr-type transport protein [Halobacteriovorax marinus SJ]